MYATVDRISPEQARQDLDHGALLICAYDDDEKFRKNRLIPLHPTAQLHWNVISRSGASLLRSTITSLLACGNTSCFGTTPILHFARASRRSASRAIRAFRGLRSMR